MTEAHPIVGKIRNALQANTAFTSKLLMQGGKQIDAVQYWSKANNYEFALSPPEEFISKRLSHISVNPNDPLNTELLVSSYVYSPNAAEHSDEGAQLLNRDEERASSVIDRFITSAEERRRLSVENAPFDSMSGFDQHHIYYVIGERGSGKTFFLNHALSKYDARFEKRKTIWVRVNLVPNRGFDDDLYSWIEAQIAKIVFRYYETTSKYRKKDYNKINLVKHLRDWIASTPIIGDEDRPRHRDNLAEMILTFCESSSDIEISRALCDRVLCKQAFKYLRENDFSFVVVLDGLDVLDIDQYHSERFHTIEQSFRTVLSSYGRYGAALVIVARKVTFRDTISAIPYFKPATGNLFYVSGASFRQILVARIRAIKKLFLAGTTKWPDSFSERDWPAVLTGFFEAFDGQVKKEQLFGSFAAIEKLSANNREKMQTVQFAFQDYLQRSTGTGYRLIDHMTKVGFEYPPIVYFYERKDEKFEIRVLRVGSYDSRLLPIIMRCPSHSTEAYLINDTFTGSPVLHGIRILQLLRITAELQSGNQDFEDVTIGELANLLHVLFGYERDRSIVYLRELAAYQVAETYVVGNISPGSEFVRARLLPKGIFLLERCIFDIAYLNLCAMRTPFRIDGLERRYIRLGKFDPLSGESLARWIATKCCNALSLTVVLLSENQAQLHSVSQSMAQILGRLKDRESAILRRGLQRDLFDFSEKIRTTAAKEIASTVKSQPKSSGEYIVERLNRLLDSMAIGL